MAVDYSAAFFYYSINALTLLFYNIMRFETNITKRGKHGIY